MNSGDLRKDLSAQIKEIIASNHNTKNKTTKLESILETIKSIEIQLIPDTAEKVYIKAHKRPFHKRYRADDEKRFMSYWLEWELPLLLCNLLVPTPTTNGKTRAGEITSNMKKSNLQLGQQWKEYLPFLHANIEYQMKRIHTKHYKRYETFPPFNDLANISDDFLD